MLGGIETGAVLDRVHQHFAKGQSYRVLFLPRQIGYFVNELNQPVGCLAITTGDELKKLRRGGKNFYTLIPDWTSGRQEQHLFKRGHGVGLGEVTEGALTHGANHIGWRAF